MLDGLWTEDCRKASLDGAGPGEVHATIKVSDDGRLPRVPRKWSHSGLILKVEVWGRWTKRMTSWFLPWAKTKAGVIIYWDGAGCRFEERDGCSTSAFWVSLSVRCLISDTDREGCWVKLHSLCLETRCTSWNSRIGTTFQSLGFRAAWLLLRPDRCLPHLQCCLSLLFFIHSFIERYMSFLCREYYKAQYNSSGPGVCLTC